MLTPSDFFMYDVRDMKQVRRLIKVVNVSVHHTIRRRSVAFKEK